MNLTLNPDLLWWNLAGLLGVLAFILLVVALFRDRPRGRRRCPRCWYDLSGTTGRTCSECGRTARRERSLHRTRRHWRLAFVAMMVFLMAGAAALTPRVQRDGWLSAVPTTVLILALPVIDDGSQSGWKAAAADELISNRLRCSWSRRPRMPGTWDWQWRLAVGHALRDLSGTPSIGSTPGRSLAGGASRRILAGALTCGAIHRLGLEEQVVDHLTTSATVTVPSPWPRDAPLPCTVSIRGYATLAGPRGELMARVPGVTSWRSHRLQSHPFPNTLAVGEPRINALVDLPTAEGLMPIEFRVPVNAMVWSEARKEWEFLPFGEVTAEAVVLRSGTLADFVSSDDEPVLDQAVRRSFDARVEDQGGRPYLLVSLGYECFNSRGAVGDFARVVLLRNETVVFDGTQTFRKWTWKFNRDDWVVSFSLEDALRDLDPKGNAVEESWTVRFWMDPVPQLIWRRSGTYWPGVIERPIDVRRALVAQAN